MLEINWKQDYENEFICPNCEQSPLGLGGFKKGERQFACPRCKSKTLASVKLSSRLRYSDSRLKDEYIDWEKDYHGEFVCPECGEAGMCAWGVKQPNNKRQFRCLSCKKTQQESFTIDKIEAIEDPLNPGVRWYTNHRIEGFICLECQGENMYLARVDKFNKKIFKCRTCKKHVYDSIILSKGNLAYYNQNQSPVTPFNWTNDRWDLRAINPNFDERDNSYYVVNFTEFE
jgi:transcription elongation factor Elf1